MNNTQKILGLALLVVMVAVTALALAETAPSLLASIGWHNLSSIGWHDLASIGWVTSPG